MRCDEGYRALWLRISRRNDRKRAIIAIARRLLLAMRSAELNGKPYIPRPRKGAEAAA